jgi:predicted site-specific integrase-resolvase
MSERATSNDNLSKLIRWNDWLKSIGLDRCTGHRYRKAGLITAVNIFGRLYLTREEIARFESRALTGEFARKFASRRNV